MLTNAPVRTMLPVKDMNRAREFYEKKLGLKPLGARQDGKFQFAGGTGGVIALFPKPEGNYLCIHEDV